jgi:hypothetical protein
MKSAGSLYAGVRNNFVRNLFLPVILFLFSLHVYAQPVITSFNPKSGPIGSTVVISGNNFNTIANLNYVYFGAVRANVISATATALTVTAPPYTTYQPISVTANGLTGYAVLPFNVTFNPGRAVFSSSSFANITDVNLGKVSSRFAIGDIDGDGRSDIVDINTATNSMSVYRNTTVGTIISIAARIELPIIYRNASEAYYYPVCFTLIDMNGDGKLDIVLAGNQPNSRPNTGLSIYINTSVSGTISFEPRIDFINGDVAEMITADLNGDGKPDVIETTPKTTLYTYPNTTTSAITFDNALTIQTNTNYVRKIFIRDLDGDGKPDLVISDPGIGAYVSQFLVYKNTGVGGAISFGPVTYYAFSGSAYHKIAVEDMDGDGKPEIVVIGKGTNTVPPLSYKSLSDERFVNVFANTSTPGNISFATNKITNYGLELGYADLSIADFDGDGKADIAALDSSMITLLKNKSTTGNFLFDSLAQIKFNTAPPGLAIADMDGDGMPDLIKLNTTGGYQVLRNLAAGPPNVITAIGDPVVTNTDDFVLFPNPVQGSVKITYPADYRNADIQVTTIEGRKMLTVKSGTGTANTMMINVVTLPKGVYLVSFLKKGKPLVVKYLVKM